MSDLERLDEALAKFEAMTTPIGMYGYDHDLLVAAARAYRDLLANGERRWWCEEHAVSTPHGKKHCWLKVIDRKLGEEETPCRIIPMLLTPLPTEEER